MDLSILIVNWHTKDYVAQAIEAVKAQAPALQFEVIVIDGASFDGCGEMLAARHPDVRYVQSATNLGFGKANNVAFASARGSVVLFLNPDTQVTPGAIQRMHAHLMSTPDAGVVGPMLLNDDGSLQETCVRAHPTILNQVLESAALRRRWPRSALWGKEPLLRDSQDPARVDAVSGACLMIRREVFERVGGFSADFFMYSEDMDLCLKVQRAGWHTYYVPAAVVRHHGDGSGGNASAGHFSAVMQLESRWRYFRRNRSRRYAALYRAAMLASSVCRIGLLAAGLAVRRCCGQAAPRTRAALGRWIATLSWALGGQQWAVRS